MTTPTSPMKVPAPTYDPVRFRPGVDRYAAHLRQVFPWKDVEIQRLYKRRSRDGWANDLQIRYFVAVSYDLVQRNNLRLHYQGRVMTVLQGTAPSFTNYVDHQPQAVAYFEWAAC